MLTQQTETQSKSALPAPVRIDPDTIWPDPSPLPAALLPVDSFMDEMLPTDLRRWIVDIAERMNVPIDFVAVPAMIAAASLIGRRIGIRPQVHTDWTEAANLWGAITGPPGTLKSPAVREAFTALHLLEKRAAKLNEAAMDEYRPRHQLFELEKKEGTRTAGKLLQDTEAPDIGRLNALDILRHLEEPASPRQIRYITNDAMPEKLGELCRDNPDGLLVHRDELLTMFTELDQEEKASGRGFLMTGWAGLDGYTVDRIIRGTIRIEAVNVSLFGTTQPSRLLNYMRSSLRTHDDGLVQRLQLLVWPDPLSDGFVNNDRGRNEAARDAAMACYERLARLNADAVDAVCQSGDASGTTPYLRFSPEAQAQFDAWRVKLEAQVAALDVSDPFRGHLAKYRGLAPRLALICHLASGGVGPVSLNAWVMAELWIIYLKSHAHRIYSALETDNTDIAWKIVHKLKTEKLERTFTARDIYKPGWSGLTLKHREQIERALVLLVEYDWLSAERVLTGGQPKTIYTVNPKVLKRTLQ
jgi:putative DNA primase/helicase